jgi:hypothetical protein
VLACDLDRTAQPRNPVFDLAECDLHHSKRVQDLGHGACASPAATAALSACST